VIFKHNFILKNVKKYTQITHALILIFNSIFYDYFLIFRYHTLNLKLCSKQYNKIDILYQIVAPQLSGGWGHNYSTKLRQ
jgi:hypothetical protein